MLRVKLFHIIFLTFGFSLILFFTTCKKYAEDGKRSWHKPEKRIIATWNLKEYLVDGEDSTYKWYAVNNSLFWRQTQWQLKDARFQFTSYTQKDYQNTVGQVIDIYLKNVIQDSTVGCPSCYLHTTSDWELKDKKTKVTFNSLDTYRNTDTLDASYSRLARALNDKWNIQKLTDKEMILEANTTAGKHLRIKFQN